MLSEKPWKPEAGLRLLLRVFVCLMVGSLTISIMHRLFAGEDGSGRSTPSIVIGTLSFQGAALIWISLFLREHRIGWSEAFGFSTPEVGRTLLLGFFTGLLFVPIGNFLQIVSMESMRLFHLTPVEQDAVQTLRNAVSWSAIGYLGVFTVILAPMAEETLFRGILYPIVKQCGYPRLAVWGTSILFGAIHLNLAIFVPLTIFAVVLTLLYENTNNLLSSILAHSLFNLAGFIKFLSQQSM